MATTYILKRKTFADPNQPGEQKKGMSTGAKVAIGGTLAAAGAVALGARGAGSMGNLMSKVGNAYKGAANHGGGTVGGIKAAATSMGRSIKAGGKDLVNGAGNLLKPKGA